MTYIGKVCDSFFTKSVPRDVTSQDMVADERALGIQDIAEPSCEGTGNCILKNEP